MSTKALSRIATLGMLAALFVGCGDGDGTKIKICTAHKTTCLSGASGTVCSADGTTELPFACDNGEVCGTGKDGKAGCVGSCEPAATECASEAIARVCSNDGKTWVNIPCEPGTGCDSNDTSPSFGTCVRSGPNVTVCEPEEATCADSRTVKSCEQDGSNWVYTACRSNEMCDDGVCVVDPDKGCTPNTGTCVDTTHVKKCADNGMKYADPEECPAETTCSDGACRGPVCTVGEVRCDDVRDGNVFTALATGTYQAQAVYTCVGGVAWEITQCASNQVCTYTGISATAVNQFIEDLKTAVGTGSVSNIPVFNVPESSRATCQTPECPAPYAFRELLQGFFEGAFFGSFACGDPTADDPAFPDSFSLCEGLPPYNNLHWANYACPEGSECNYQQGVSLPDGDSIQAPVCQSTCTEGDVRCLETDPSGESTITCHRGEWNAASIEKCHDGGREQWCRTNLQSGGDDYTQATCQDPACVIWKDEFETFVVPPGYGACGDDGMFYRCLPNGLMDEGVECSNCVRSVTRAPSISPASQTPSFFGGYQPGYCLPECQDSEEVCLDIGSQTTSPFYYQCDHGHFTKVASCADGKACNNVTPTTTQPLRSILCGNLECQPNQTRCTDEEGLAFPGDFRQTCNENGEWDAPEACPRGVCTQDNQQSVGVAECEDECIPNTKSCSGNLAEVTCNSRARYGDPVDCGTGEACMVGNPQLANLGCVECVPFVTGSNTIADSRCDGDELEVCGPDGTWATRNATKCPSGCTGAQAGETVPGSSRARCLPSTGSGGAGGSGPGGAGSGGFGLAGFGGLGGLG